MLNEFMSLLKTAQVKNRKPLVKKGTIQCDAVEATPVVWKGKLLRFEWQRNSSWASGALKKREYGCYCFIDMETNEPYKEFAKDYTFGSCHAEGDTMYVFGTKCDDGKFYGNTLDVFYSKDLNNWASKRILEIEEDTIIFNTSVCKGPDRYIMAVEVGNASHQYTEKYGHPYTIIFAESTDLLNWEWLPCDRYIYTKDRYSACPVIRYVDGMYYMIYLESLPCYRSVPYIVRTKDLENYELGITNPIMFFDDNDRKLYNEEWFTEEEKERILHACNVNNSDVDLCEYEGKTILLYSWGNQSGKEFLARADYDGSMGEFLKSFFE